MDIIKEAARDAPNKKAIVSKEETITYGELDQLVEKGLHPSPIVQMFAAWRKEKSYFPTNPRLPAPPAKVKPPPQTLLLYTSGSTGTPKIAILSLGNLIANAKSVIEALALSPSDEWKLTLPLFHVGGIGIVIRCILARATLILDDSPNITHLSYVPTHLYRATPIYRKLKCILLGGAPIHHIPPNLPIYTTYGLTEMGSMVTLNGKILPHAEVNIASDGELFVRGASLFQGYYGEPPQKGWFPTKDLGTMENNQLKILGRKDWMFISGGENIQPEEIEQHLLCFPEVIEAVVLPINDEEFGKRPIAIVSAHTPFSLQEMQNRLAKFLPKFKIPIALRFASEIPKKNLKIDRSSQGLFLLSQTIQEQLVSNKAGQKNRAYL